MKNQSTAILQLSAVLQTQAMPRIACRFQARCTQSGTSTDELHLGQQPGWIFRLPFEREQKRAEVLMEVRLAVRADQKAALPPEVQREAFHLAGQRVASPLEILVVFPEEPA